MTRPVRAARKSSRSLRVAGAAPPDADAVARFADLAQAILGARGDREAHFPARLFGEPSWDILLALYVARTSRRVVATGAVAAAAGLAPTVALRTLALLERDNWLQRSAAEAGDATVVTLTDRAVVRLEDWLAGHFHLQPDR